MTSGLPARHPKAECVARQGEEDTVFFYKNPVTNELLRFNELQHSMLQKLDGRTPLDALCAQLSDAFEVELPTRVAERFAAQAAELMLLDDHPERAAQLVGARRLTRRIRRAVVRSGLVLEPPAVPVNDEAGRVLVEVLEALAAQEPVRAWRALDAARGFDDPRVERYRAAFRTTATDTLARGRQESGHKLDLTIQLGMFESAPLARWLARHLGFLYGEPFLWCAVGLWFLSVALLLVAPTPPFAVHPLEGAIIFTVVWLRTAWHELAHASALAKAGRTPGRIGFALIHGIVPIAFTDANEAILLTRRQRAVVYLVGWAQDTLINCGIALYVFLAPVHTALYRPLYVAAWSFVAIHLLNLNPFFRGDGYLVLTDLVGERDLYSRAFAHVRSALAFHLWGAGERPEAPPRSALLYWGYVLGATAMFLAILRYGATDYLLAFAVRHFGWLGFELWLVVCALLFGRQLVYLLAGAWRLLRSLRPSQLGRRQIAVIGAVLAAIAALFVVHRPLHIEAPFELVPVERRPVRAGAAGRIAQIAVREGQHVQKGQLLALLESPELDEQLAIAQADWREALAEQRLIDHGARPSERARASARVGQAKAEATFDRALAAREDQLAGLGVSSALVAAGARSSAEQQQALQAGREAQQALVEQGARSEDRAAAAARVAAAAAKVEQLRAREARLRVVAPIDGLIETARPEEQLGQAVAEGATVVVLGSERMRAEIAVPAELRLGEIAPGGKVRLRLDGFPGEGLEGQVAEVAERASTEDAGQRLTVFTGALAGAPALTGLTGRARIYGAEHALAMRWFFLDVGQLIAYRLWSLS